MTGILPSWFATFRLGHWGVDYPELPVRRINDAQVTFDFATVIGHIVFLVSKVFERRCLGVEQLI